MLGDAVVVDEPPAGLVQRRDEAGVVVEGGEHEGVVFPVDLEDGLHVHLGVLRCDVGCGRPGRGKERESVSEWRAGKL